MKSTRILGWVALGLVAGAAVLHCGGDDSNSIPPGGGGQGQGGSHAGSSGSTGTSGSSSGNMGTAGGASGAGGANPNTGGMAGTANIEGGAGTSGAGGAAGAGSGDSGAVDARDSGSTTDAGTASVSPANPADSGTDVTSGSDAPSINDSAAAADGDGGLCPGNKPSDGASCTAFANCGYGNQGRCICSRAGLAADAGRTWRCNGGIDAGGAADSGAGCPGAKPEGGVACTNPGLLCQFGNGGPCVCVDVAQTTEWLCF